MTMILFAMTVSCTTGIALDLLAIEMNNYFGFGIMTTIIDLLLMLGIMFTYSCLSELISSDLIEIGDFFYNFAWYQLLPVEKQKLLVLPIQRAQREVRLSGLGLCDCSLEVFSKVSFWLYHLRSDT